MHGLDESGDVTAFGFCGAEPVIGRPCIPAKSIVNILPTTSLWQQMCLYHFCCSAIDPGSLLSGLCEMPWTSPSVLCL